MTDVPLPTGKFPAPLLTRALRAFGPHPPEVLLGPAIGEDACALAVGSEVLVVAADPITLTGSGVGRSAVIINANDVAVTGARPRWFLATLLLPPGTSIRAVDAVFEAMRDALQEVGAVLVGGHTEITGAVTQPVVAGQMLGTAERIVRTGGLSPGDVVVQVGLCPVEDAVVLATGADVGLDAAVLDEARAATISPGISVVDAALVAADLGACAMHDPTEGGLAAGLHELATASGVSLEVDRKAVLWYEPGVALCSALGADPWATLASGCLLAGFRPDRAADALTDLRARGLPAAVIASAGPGTGVRDREGTPIPWPGRDEVARLLAD